MAIQSIVLCDVCRKQKGEVNHWYLIDLEDIDNERILTVGEHKDIPVDERSSTVKDVCGAECAMKIIQRYLDHETLEPTK